MSALPNPYEAASPFVTFIVLASVVLSFPFGATVFLIVAITLHAILLPIPMPLVYVTPVIPSPVPITLWAETSVLTSCPVGAIIISSVSSNNPAVVVIDNPPPEVVVAGIIALIEYVVSLDGSANVLIAA